MLTRIDHTKQILLYNVEQHTYEGEFELGLSWPKFEIRSILYFLQNCQKVAFQNFRWMKL